MFGLGSALSRLGTRIRRTICATLESCYSDMMETYVLDRHESHVLQIMCHLLYIPEKRSSLCCIPYTLLYANLQGNCCRVPGTRDSSPEIHVAYFRSKAKGENSRVRSMFDGCKQTLLLMEEKSRLSCARCIRHPVWAWVLAEAKRSGVRCTMVYDAR